MKTNHRHPPPPLPPARRRLFVLVLVLLPFLLLALLEGGLRVGGYGTDLSAFRRITVAGKEYLSVNPDVKGRYFSRVAFSPNISPDIFAVRKAPGTFRIFCLGGSTTVGFPYSFIGAFPTFLGDRLKAVAPERQIEIINAGITATNSTTVLDLARDVLDQDPDLLIVYDGHNEFYGALGAASTESGAPAVWLNRLVLRLVRFRTVQLLRDLTGTVAGWIAPAADGSGTMMDVLARGRYVDEGDDTYRRALEVFRANLDDLSRLCKERGVPLILTTQVSNLRDCAPFVSGHRAGMSPQETLAFQRAVNRGMEFMLNAAPDSALTSFAAASAIDSHHAEVRYRLGQCYERLGRTQEALREYRRARDLDRLRFRTSGEFNDLLRSFDARGGTAVVDVERLFQGMSPDSLVGSNLILEHLHPTARGSFLIASALARRIRTIGLFATPDQWAAADSLPDDRLWEDRAMTPFDEEIARRRTMLLTSGWPFTSADPHLRPPPFTDTLATLVDDVVLARKNWEEGHVAAAQYFAAHRDFARAAAEYRAILRLIPYSVSPYLALAQMHLAAGDPSAARRALEQSRTVEKTSYAARTIGSMQLNSGHPDSAIAELREAFTLGTSDGEWVEAGTLLGIAYARMGNTADAEAILRTVLRLNPQARDASALLRRLTTRQP